MRERASAPSAAGPVYNGYIIEPIAVNHLWPYHSTPEDQLTRLRWSNTILYCKVWVRSATATAKIVNWASSARHFSAIRCISRAGATGASWAALTPAEPVSCHRSSVSTSPACSAALGSSGFEFHSFRFQTGCREPIRELPRAPGSPWSARARASRP